MALHGAISLNSIEDVKRMVEDPHVNINGIADWGRTPFIQACVFKRAEMVRLLLNSKREINYNSATADAAGWTAFHCACYHGDRSIMEMLLADPRINISALTVEGESCFHIVCWGVWGIGAVKMLLASDRPEILQALNERDNDNHTPRDVAHKKGNPRAVELIDAYNADPVGVRDNLRIELGWPAYVAAELFATIILLCDDYYEIKE